MMGLATESDAVKAHLLDMLFANNVHGMAQVSRDGRYLDCNQRLADMLGYTQNELTTKSIRDVTPPEDFQQDAAWINVFQNGERGVLHREKRYLTRGGDVIWANLTVIPLWIGDELQYFMTIVQDVSGRVHVIEELRESEARLKLLLNGTQDTALFTLDGCGRITAWSDAANKVTGYAEHEAIGRHIVITYPQELQATADEALRLAADNGSHEYEAFRRRKDGSLFWALVVTTCVRSSAGEVIGFNKLVRNLDARLQSEERARQTEAKFRIIADSISDGVLSMDQDSNIISCNNGLCAMFGYTEAELCAMNLTDLIPARYRAAHSAGMTRYLGTGERRLPWNGLELVALRRDGSEFHIEVSFADYEQGGRRFFSGLIRDVTARRAQEAHLLQAKRTAESASRAKSFFLSSMSHEIRTPLTSIIGYSQKIERAGSLSAAARADVRVIIQSCKHLLGLLNNILDFSKIESGQLDLSVKTFDLQDAIRESADILFAIARDKGLSIDLACVSPVPVTLTTDENKFRQILINVMGNAIKYTESGRIVLELRYSSASNPPMLQLRVRDTGVGVSRENQRKIFRVFNRGDMRKIEGTGLGLPLSRSLARALGGDLRLEKSVLGEGSTFLLTVPAPLGGVALKVLDFSDVGDRPDVASTSPRQQGSSDLLKGKVLIAEDVPEIANLTKFCIESLGLHGHIVENGRDALDAMAHDAFDLVLMDLEMPVMGGLEATERIRSRGDRVPVIALSAHAIREEIDRATEIGCDDFLTKPLDLDRLRQVLLRHLT